MWHTEKQKYPTIARHSWNVTHRKEKVPDYHPTQLQCDTQESKSTRPSPDTIGMWHTGKQKYPTIIYQRHSCNVTHRKAKVSNCNVTYRKAKVPIYHPTQWQCDTQEIKSTAPLSNIAAVYIRGLTYRKSKAPHHYPTLLQFTYKVWHTGSQFLLVS